MFLSPVSFNPMWKPINLVVVNQICTRAQYRTPILNQLRERVFEENFSIEKNMKKNEINLFINRLKIRFWKFNKKRFVLPLRLKEVLWVIGISMIVWNVQSQAAHCPPRVQGRHFSFPKADSELPPTSIHHSIRSSFFRHFRGYFTEEWVWFYWKNRMIKGYSFNISEDKRVCLEETFALAFLEKKKERRKSKIYFL